MGEHLMEPAIPPQLLSSTIPQAPNRRSPTLTCAPMQHAVHPSPPSSLSLSLQQNILLPCIRIRIITTTLYPQQYSNRNERHDTEGEGGKKKGRDAHETGSFEISHRRLGRSGRENGRAGSVMARERRLLPSTQTRAGLDGRVSGGREREKGGSVLPFFSPDIWLRFQT